MVQNATQHLFIFFSKIMSCHQIVNYSMVRADHIQLLGRKAISRKTNIFSQIVYLLEGHHL